MTDLAWITATNCCVCSLPLTDPESVEHGIGPVCSGKYYDPRHVPTDYQVAVALGILATSTHIAEDVKMAAASLKHDARMLCKVLLKWASKHYDDPQVVLDCADTMRALGYITLAEKLQGDRLKVVIKEDPKNPDRVLVYHKRGWAVWRNMSKVPGAVQVPHTKRHEGWSVDQKHLSTVKVVLGHAFPNEKALDSDGIFRLTPHTYLDLLVALGGHSKPKAVVVCRVEGSRVAIKTPYNTGYITDLKASVPSAARYWTGSEWKVDSNYAGVLRALVQKHFNVTI